MLTKWLIAINYRRRTIVMTTLLRMCRAHSFTFGSISKAQWYKFWRIVWYMNDIRKYFTISNLSRIPLDIKLSSIQLRSRMISNLQINHNQIRSEKQLQNWKYKFQDRLHHSRCELRRIRGRRFYSHYLYWLKRMEPKKSELSILFILHLYRIRKHQSIY